MLTSAECKNMLEAAAFSQPGQDARVNGDCLLADPSRGLFAVADGVGRTPEAAAASRLAIEALDSTLREVRHSDRQEAIRDALKQAFHAANAALLAESQKRGRASQSTMTAAIVRGPSLICAHCGDSRAYLATEAAADCLTKDHSIVGDLVRSQLLPPDAVEGHPHRSILSACLGLYETCRVEYFERRIRFPQTLLLCTDGVWAHVSPDELTAGLRLGLGLEALADRFVCQAREKGSRDDRTVILVRPRAGVTGANAICQNHSNQ
jgi:PPM family protein phosphatase